MINASNISQKIISQLDKLGIDSKVDGKDSETANMIKVIVAEIISAIKIDGEVVVSVATTGTPTVHSGTGTGKVR